MRKYEFLYKLSNALSSYPKQERDEIVYYYDELIQDAIDNGEDEEAFIERLGSVDKITRTIKKDETFVNNIRVKQDFELHNVFSTSVRIIGYFIYVIFLIVAISIGVGFVSGGAGGAISSLILLIINIKEGEILALDFFLIGSILACIGIFILGIAMFSFIGKKSKAKLEQIFEKIDQLIKGGKKE